LLGAGRESLQRQISRYSDLLDVLKGRAPFFERFKSWAEVVEYLNPTKLNSPQGDIALGALIRMHQEHRDHRWSTILLAICWPLLQILYKARLKAVSAEQKGTLWSDISWLFIKTINKPALRERQERFSAMIYNYVLHDLKHINMTNREENSRLCGLDAKEVLRDYHAVSEVDWNIQQIDITKSWKRLKEQGRLDDIDFHLVRATILYDEPLIEYACRLGLDYEFVKKRKQRAIKILKKLLIVCPQIKKKTPFR